MRVLVVVDFVKARIYHLYDYYALRLVVDSYAIANCYFWAERDGTLDGA